MLNHHPKLKILAHVAPLDTLAQPKTVVRVNSNERLRQEFREHMREFMIQKGLRKG